VSDVERTGDNTGERSAAVGDDGVDLGPAFALAAACLAVPLVVIACLLFAVLPGPWWLGLLLGIAVACLLVWLRLRSAASGVLSKLGGGLLQADGSVRLENLVQGLSLAGGVEEPDVVVLSDPARNAMAVRAPTGSGDRNHLVITQGLLQTLDVVELEGVVAELLTRLKNGDAEAATVGAALFGQPILDGPLGSVLGRVASFGLQRLLSEDRDLEADRQAVSLTRYPPGLFGALKLIGEGEIMPKSYTPGTGHLWLIDPERSTAEVGGSRAPLDLRIDVLAEL
jgi:heat shock protein HtpX